MGFLKKCKPFRPAVWTAAIANRNIYNFDPNSCNISIGNEILEELVMTEKNNFTLKTQIELLKKDNKNFLIS